MLLTITLLKNHSTPDKEYLAGETIEVDEGTYDWLQFIYAADKVKATLELKEADKKKRRQSDC